LVIGALAEGNSIRSIERMTGIQVDTVMRLGVRVGQACEMLLDERMRDLAGSRIEVDEIWGFIGKKQANIRITELPPVNSRSTAVDVAVASKARK
jgi:hypothetical protein